MPIEFMFGRPLIPEELDMIREQARPWTTSPPIDDELRGSSSGLPNFVAPQDHSLRR
jgi:hypothetical protein